MTTFCATPQRYDLVVIGAGPAGQKGAVQAAKAGRRTLVVDEEGSVGGACVRRGTIPSKTLRETAIAFEAFRRRTAGVVDVTVPHGLRLESLMTRLDAVVAAHERFMGDQLARNEVELCHGRAAFVDPHTLAIDVIDGTRRVVHADVVLIATGSRPRKPAHVAIDHEHILDSDSILSLTWLPASLVVLGAGVIASEYASVFAALGVHVTIVDAGARPLGFLDGEVVAQFVSGFERAGGRVLAGRRATQVVWNGIDAVVTTLDDGRELRSERVLCALGREANVAGLNLAAAGLTLDARGLVPVDEHLRTAVRHIYGVGDVIGPPALAATAMEQGRRAVCRAFGLAAPPGAELLPIGVYTVPELASIGLDEAAAAKAPGGCMVGRARWGELARGAISGAEDGLLKLVTDGAGRRLLGVQVAGEGATELIHVGQMALVGGLDVDVFVDHAMNFPTMAEAYRVAALEVVNRRRQASLCAVAAP
jgi:NAD(P) transhydrogenase